MGSELSSTAIPSLQRVGGSTRIGFLGSRPWLDNSMPAPRLGLAPRRFDAAGDSQLHKELQRFAPDVVVAIDPPAMTPEAISALRSTSAPTLALLTGALPDDASAWADAVDRIVSFDPSLTGAPLGGTTVWRAVPTPVSDVLFADGHALHHKPRAIAVGRSTSHREQMLLPSKHDHDLLQVIHGLSGGELANLLGETDVGVYVAPDPDGRFGHQAAMHLAAGQLLLAERLQPSHGLECGIDYVRIDSPQSLAWTLERLTRFPEMHERARIRGRMKAEHFRASRLFARLVYDLRADIATFGQRRV